MGKNRLQLNSSKPEWPWLFKDSLDTVISLLLDEWPRSIWGSSLTFPVWGAHGQEDLHNFVLCLNCIISWINGHWTQSLISWVNMMMWGAICTPWYSHFTIVLCELLCELPLYYWAEFNMLLLIYKVFFWPYAILFLRPSFSNSTCPIISQIVKAFSRYHLFKNII